MTRARADGPTAITRAPTVGASAPAAAAGNAPATRPKRRSLKSPTRVEFNNYKASYLRM
jgi:hypothetical protein